MLACWCWHLAQCPHCAYRAANMAIHLSSLFILCVQKLFWQHGHILHTYTFTPHFYNSGGLCVYVVKLSLCYDILQINETKRMFHLKRLI